MTLGPELERLVTTIDRDLGPAIPEGEAAQIIRVTEDGEVALRSLDGEHPFDALLGFVAPDHWLVFGVAAPGWGTIGPSRRRCRAVHVVSRDGSEASSLRFEDELEPSVMSEPGAGRVADCVRRAMNVPTPEETDEALLLAVWASTLLAAVAASPQRVGAPQVPRLLSSTPRPASWGDERWAVIQAGGNALMDGVVATWMDDGMFARLMMAEMTPPDEIMPRAKKNCTAEGWRRLLLAIGQEIQ